MVLREFHSVIRLLDDHTPEVQTQVHKKLREFYFSLSPDQWQEFIASQPQHLQNQLYELYKNLNKQYFRLYYNLWAGTLTDRDHELIAQLSNRGITVHYDESLTFFLYLVTRLLSPFVSYVNFKSLFDALLLKFPAYFEQSNTPLEQARYFTWLFYKWDRFYWTMEDPLWVTFDPLMALKNRKGSGFTIAMIMAALAEQLGLDWFVLSDSSLRASYLVIPVDKYWSVQPLLINTTTGVILNQMPQVISESLIRYLKIGNHKFVSAYYFLAAYLNYQFLPGDLHKLVGKIVFSLSKILNENF